jgi:hypothetical protein
MENYRPTNVTVAQNTRNVPTCFNLPRGLRQRERRVVELVNEASHFMLFL